MMWPGRRRSSSRERKGEEQPLPPVDWTREDVLRAVWEEVEHSLRQWHEPAMVQRLKEHGIGTFALVHEKTQTRETIGRWLTDESGGIRPISVEEYEARWARVYEQDSDEWPCDEISFCIYDNLRKVDFWTGPPLGTRGRFGARVLKEDGNVKIDWDSASFLIS